MGHIIQRSFMPGSDWLYLKIYTGTNSSEAILVSEIFSLIKRLKSKDLIEKWFFIRFADPETHLRLRFFLKDSQQIGEIIRLCYDSCNRLLLDNRIWKIQFDTYNRELERYGGELIGESESVFFIDSESTMQILRMLKRYNNEHYRWMIALKMIDRLLSDFQYNILQKYQLVESLSLSYKEEFGFNEYNAKQFNTKFRENKYIIESVLDGTVSDINFQKLCNSLKKKSSRLAPHVEYIIGGINHIKPQISMDYLLQSFIHMMVNRLFRAKSRKHELIIYDFMRRYYLSKIAREKLKTII